FVAWDFSFCGILPKGTQEQLRKASNHDPKIHGYCICMLIILPPSETKAFGGDGDPLDLASLSFPSLHVNRQNIIDILRQYDVDEAMKVIKIYEAIRPQAK